jgi:hypothetical protein
MDEKTRNILIALSVAAVTFGVRLAWNIRRVRKSQEARGERDKPCGC